MTGDMEHYTFSWIHKGERHSKTFLARDPEEAQRCVSGYLRVEYGIDLEELQEGIRRMVLHLGQPPTSFVRRVREAEWRGEWEDGLPEGWELEDASEEQT